MVVQWYVQSSLSRRCCCRCSINTDDHALYRSFEATLSQASKSSLLRWMLNGCRNANMVQWMEEFESSKSCINSCTSMIWIARRHVANTRQTDTPTRGQHIRTEDILVLNGWMVTYSRESLTSPACMPLIRASWKRDSTWQAGKAFEKQSYELLTCHVLRRCKSRCSLLWYLNARFDMLFALQCDEDSI